jgi:pimeloyl-ACP methyl ester carboxylesterase
MTPTDRFVDVAGVKTRYWARGSSGPTVLLLHGIGCSVLEWKHNIQALAARHRVVALDLLGFGLTDKPADADYTLRGHARFVLDAMTALGIERAHIVGNSLGARLGLECAVMAPARVTSLVLVDPAGMDLRPTIIDFRLASLPLVGELATRPSPMGLRMLWRKAFFDPDAHVTKALVADKVALAALPGAQAAFLKTLRHFLNFQGFLPDTVRPLHAAMPNIQAPTLVIWGHDDRFVPHTHAHVVARLMPEVQVQVWDRCGHTPQIEQAQRFNEVVPAFLQGVDAEG